MRFTWILLWACSFTMAQTGELPIVVEADKSFTSQIFSFGRNVDIAGSVDSDVGAAFADVRISGLVNGDVSVLRGTITLTSSASVTGNLVCVGGRVIQEDGAQIQGESIRLLSASSSQMALPKLAGKALTALFFARTLLVFILVIALFYLFPTQVRQASFDLEHDVTRTTLMGVIALGMFTATLFISFLLMVVAIGVPLFILIGCVLTICDIFGQVVVYVWAGRVIEKRTGGHLSTVSAVFVAVLVVALISLIPWIGTALQAAILVLGTGIVILTRFGTNKTWFTRKVRYWSAQ